MRALPWLFLVLLLGMCGVIGGLFLTEAAPPIGAHPLYSSMTQGSVEHQRDATVVALGTAFGVLQLVFFITCLAFGAGARGRPFVVFVIVGALHLVVFGALVTAHTHYLSGADSGLVLSLPEPTAWMLYVLWPLPVVFAGWYSFRFDQVIYPQESRTRFAQLLDRRRAGETLVGRAAPEEST